MDVMVMNNFLEVFRDKTIGSDWNIDAVRDQILMQKSISNDIVYGISIRKEEIVFTVSWYSDTAQKCISISKVLAGDDITTAKFGELMQQFLSKNTKESLELWYTMINH